MALLGLKLHVTEGHRTRRPCGTLKSKYFYVGNKAHDADYRVIYNEATGALCFDSDGTGSHAQVQFAAVGNHSTAGLNYSGVCPSYGGCRRVVREPSTLLVYQPEPPSSKAVGKVFIRKRVSAKLSSI